jgi:A/G-specific adenine glycosylase
LTPLAFRRKLLAWYRRHKRDLPWRRTSDPYRIWVSEIMLQQTQVSTVIPFYERFLDRFPTAPALAAAPETEVLAAWAGLGYYRRARFLHAAAKEITERHGGSFPNDPEARLPGIGRYTRAAILSIAYGRPLAVLDGNVARVLSRVRAIAGEPKKNEKRLWELAEELLEPSNPGDWNQAMMELGATVCLPAAPRCEICPVSDACEARRRGLQDELPTPAARKREVAVSLDCVVCDRGGRLLIERRAAGLLSDHWALPENGPAFEGGEPWGTVRHQITHHKVTLTVRPAKPKKRLEAGRYKWVPRTEAKRLLISSLWKKALQLTEP